MKNPRPDPNWVRPAADAINRAPLRAGSVSVLAIAHDGHCGHWKGRRCNCEPTVKLVEIPNPKSGSN